MNTEIAIVALIVLLAIAVSLLVSALSKPSGSTGEPAEPAKTGKSAEPEKPKKKPAEGMVQCPRGHEEKTRSARSGEKGRQFPADREDPGQKRGKSRGDTEQNEPASAG